jgi:DNA-3-methyladenine glycosylase I
MKNRCFWVSDSQLYRDYHDNEWGEPVYKDQTLFEFLILETFQAGLSWITILNKRENFRKAFDDFDYQKIAEYPDKKCDYKRTAFYGSSKRIWFFFYLYLVLRCRKTNY